MNSPLNRFLIMSGIWFALWFLALLIIPVTSYLPNQEFIWVLNLSFLLSVFFSFLLVFYAFRYGNNKVQNEEVNRKYIYGKQLRFNVLLSSLGGVLGFLFIFYDRVFIRGIDYTAGLRAARYQWLRESTGGSLFSVIGNLIVPFGYVSLFLLVVFFKELKKTHKLFLFLSSSLGVVGHAALNGGRSNLLIAIFVFLIIYIFTNKIGKHNINKTSSKGYFYLSFVLVFSFVIYMTVQSASVANISLVELVGLGVTSLYGAPTNNFEQIVNDYTALPVYIFSYLFHGSWTAEALYSISERPGSYLFYPISVIASSIGIMDSPIAMGYFSESGAFISFPGAIYYDFGFWGLIIFGIILGGFVGGAVYLLTRKRVTLITFGFCLYPLVIFFMLPILPAYGLIYFNFVVYAFLFFGFLNKVLYYNRCYWL
ncbi:oligosaccharide repeat unit polymerase [Vibrio harveyi]